ncbi:MAG: hypothetical protein WC708_20470 [Lentisphaeria bacterium]
MTFRIRPLHASILLLAATGLFLLAPAARAADKAAAADTPPAKAEKAEKKGAKAKKAAEAPAEEKAAPTGLPEGVDEETVKKEYPDLFKLREKLLTMGADIRELKGAESSKDKKKAEVALPKMEKKFKVLLDRMTKEYDKLSKPIDDEKEALVAQDANLGSKISELESAGKKTDKLAVQKTELEKRLKAVEQKENVLRWLTKIPSTDDK